MKFKKILVSSVLISKLPEKVTKVIEMATKIKFDDLLDITEQSTINLFLNVVDKETIENYGISVYEIPDGYEYMQIPTKKEVYECNCVIVGQDLRYIDPSTRDSYIGIKRIPFKFENQE